ncbi:MAG: DUF167 domain-containing protein [Steroidobacter sp.]
MRSSVRINIYVQPRASKTAIAGRHDNAIRIRLAAPPVDGAANAALVEFVAERLDIAKSRVRVVAGHASRRKVIEIDDVTMDEVSAALG